MVEILSAAWNLLSPTAKLKKYARRFNAPSLDVPSADGSRAYAPPSGVTSPDGASMERGEVGVKKIESERSWLGRLVSWIQVSFTGLTVGGAVIVVLNFALPGVAAATATTTFPFVLLSLPAGFTYLITGGSALILGCSANALSEEFLRQALTNTQVQAQQLQQFRQQIETLQGLIATFTSRLQGLKKVHEGLEQTEGRITVTAGNLEAIATKFQSEFDFLHKQVEERRQKLLELEENVDMLTRTTSMLTSTGVALSQTKEGMQEQLKTITQLVQGNQQLQQKREDLQEELITLTRQLTQAAEDAQGSLSESEQLHQEQSRQIAQLLQALRDSHGQLQGLQDERLEEADALCHKRNARLEESRKTNQDTDDTRKRKKKASVAVERFQDLARQRKLMDNSGRKIEVLQQQTLRSNEIGQQKLASRRRHLAPPSIGTVCPSQPPRRRRRI